MSLPKPWYRKSKKAWYLQVSRTEQIRLGKTRTEADAAYRDWLLDQGNSPPPKMKRKVTVGEIAREFLAHSLADNKPKTYAAYAYVVEPFC